MNFLSLSRKMFNLMTMDAKLPSNVAKSIFRYGQSTKQYHFQNPKKGCIMRIESNLPLFSQFPENEVKVVKKPGLYAEESTQEIGLNPYDIDLEINENLDAMPEGVKLPSGSCACSKGCSGGCFSNHTNCK